MGSNNQQAELQKVVEPFYDWWNNYVKQVNEGAQAYVAGLTAASDLQQWRRGWLDALTQSLDTYMRSPAFLEAMKHNMQAAVQAREQVNDVGQEMARNAQIPTLNDISGLFERIKSLEVELIHRLEKIEQRLLQFEPTARTNGHSPS